MSSLATKAPSRVAAPAAADLFFPRDRLQVANEVFGSCQIFPRDVSTLIVDHVIGNENPFGANEWHRWWGADVLGGAAEPELPKAFYNFWYDKDPFEPKKQVCDTWFPPVLRPRFVTVNNKLHSYSLKTLEKLMRNPQGGGHPSRYHSRTDALCTHGETKAGPGPTCWLTMRKRVLEQRKSFVEQEAYLKTHGYEMPSALDIATILAARHVFTGERYFGDETGVERCETYGRAKECYCSTIVGGFAPGGLRVEYRIYNKNSMGVAALRRF